MPPKKRTRSAAKGDDTAPDAAITVSSDNEIDGPAPKRTRANGKAAASKSTTAKAAATKSKASQVVASIDDSEDAADVPTTKKSRASGKAADTKLAASKAATSGTAKSKATAKITSKKGKGKQVIDDAQDAVAGAAAEDDDEDQKITTDLINKPMKKQKTDAQVLKTPNLAIPVDEHSPYSATHRVYIAPDGVVYDASLNQTNIGANNNKFYRIQLLVGRSGYDHVVWTRWGRVGDRGQSKPLDADSLEGAMSDYNSKFKAKTGLAWEARNDPPHKNKYTFIERSYEPDSSELEGDDDDMDGLPGAGSRRGSKHSATSQAASKLEEPVQKLMQLIFSQHLFNEVMAEMNYDPQKLPLGKLSKRTISQGYEHLKQLAHLIMNPGTGTTADGDTVVDLTNAYLSVVPHAFGRNKPQPITTQQALKREIELLESLSDMKIAEDLMAEAKVVDNTTHPIDRQYNGLGLKEMTPLNHKSVEYKELEQYLLKTKGETHSVGYKIEDIFRIERDGEFERFNSSPYGPLAQDRRLLWHGSRTTNFGGILSQGLRIAPPEAPVSGYMFDKGVYLADMSSKSANYCNAHSSDGIGLLLLCEAELGKPMLELEQSNYDAAALCKKNGSIATWGKGTNGPLKWKDAKCLHPSLKGTTMPDVSIAPGNTGVGDKSKVGWGNLYYNEYIAYDVAQIRLRYLFRVQMGSEY